MIGSILRFSSGKDGEEAKADDIAEDAVSEDVANESHSSVNNFTEDDSSENNANVNNASKNNRTTSQASSDEVISDNDPDDSVKDHLNQDESAPAVEPEPLPEIEAPVTREKHYTLDELGDITHRILADENIEVSKVKPFIWSVIDAYTDRFQAFPFDAQKALFNYLELDERPGSELKELVKGIEALYEKQQGEPMRKPGLSAKESEPPLKPLITDMRTQEELLDEELKELRETLKYAAMVGERLDDTI